MPAVEYQELLWIPIFLEDGPEEPIECSVSATIEGVDKQGFKLRNVRIRPLHTPTAWSLETWLGPDNLHAGDEILNIISDSLVTSSVENYFWCFA